MKSNGILWVKELPKADLAYINLLTHCRIYHYNLRNDSIRKSILLQPAEADRITKVTCLLRTKDGKNFTIVYYLPDKEAEQFLISAEHDFTEVTGG